MTARDILRIDFKWTPYPAKEAWGELTQSEIENIWGEKKDHKGWSASWSVYDKFYGVGKTREEAFLQLADCLKNKMAEINDVVPTRTPPPVHLKK